MERTRLDRHAEGARVQGLGLGFVHADRDGGCAELPFNEGSFHAPDLEFIGYGAFNGCSRLKEAYVYGCTDIDSEAFWGSSLEAIHFSTDEAYELEGFATRWGAGADVEVYVDL